MDLDRKITSRSLIYGILGRLLLSVGFILGCLVSLRLLRGEIDHRIENRFNFLLIGSTPVVTFPPATPPPTLTPAPSPTATPLPLPVIRLSIPSIGLNSVVEEVFPIETYSSNGEIVSVWDAETVAVGHYDTSGNPGEGRNIVLSGHNNMLGEVFRDLNYVSLGDEIILFTEDRAFYYHVQKKYIIPFLGEEEEGSEQLRSFAAPQSTEMVTLISCWPYATNANRIIIIAVPFISDN